MADICPDDYETSHSERCHSFWSLLSSLSLCSLMKLVLSLFVVSSEMSLWVSSLSDDDDAICYLSYLLFFCVICFLCSFLLFYLLSGIRFLPQYLHSDDEDHERYDEFPVQLRRRSDWQQEMVRVVVNVWSYSWFMLFSHIFGWSTEYSRFAYSLLQHGPYNNPHSRSPSERWSGSELRIEEFRRKLSGWSVGAFPLFIKRRQWKQQTPPFRGLLPLSWGAVLVYVVTQVCPILYWLIRVRISGLLRAFLRSTGYGVLRSYRIPLSWNRADVSVSCTDRYFIWTTFGRSGPTIDVFHKPTSTYMVLYPVKEPLCLR